MISEYESKCSKQSVLVFKVVGVDVAVIFLLAVLLLLRSFYFMCVKISRIEGPA